MTASQLRAHLLLSLVAAAGCVATPDPVAPPEPVDLSTIGGEGTMAPARQEHAAPEEPTRVGTAAVAGSKIAGPEEPKCHASRRGDPCWPVPDPEPFPCFDCGDGIGIEIPRPRGRPFDDRLAVVSGRRGAPEAARWVGFARSEHASVAAFARHVLELMHVGAPMELVAAASRAQLDEVRHTGLCLHVARQHGADVELGPLDTSGAPRTDLRAVLMGVATEGCIGEALSVWEMISDLERDPRTSSVLAELIADELRHAALAWRTLAWGFPRLEAGERADVLAALAERPAHVAPAVFEAVVGRPAARLAA